MGAFVATRRRTGFLVGAALLILSALVAAPASAAGGETLHFSFKGQQADAFFPSVDPSGCVFTDVFVFAVDRRVKEASHPEASMEAGVSISQFDGCTGTQLLAADGSATLADGAFQIVDLDSATLNATIEVFDFVSGSSFPVDVSVTWAGFGATTREKSHFQFTTPGFKIKTRSDGTFRGATASGTVSDGTTNFTPEPAISAGLKSLKAGEVQIIHE